MDKETTGAVLLAKSKDMKKTLMGLFRERKIEKVYWALCKNVPAPDQGEELI